MIDLGCHRRITAYCCYSDIIPSNKTLYYRKNLVFYTLLDIFFTSKMCSANIKSFGRNAIPTFIIYRVVYASWEKTVPTFNFSYHGLFHYYLRTKYTWETYNFVDRGAKLLTSWWKNTYMTYIYIYDTIWMFTWIAAHV